MDRVDEGDVGLDPRDSTTVAVFESETEASAAMGLLQSGGIACYLSRDRVGRALPFPGAGMGVRLRVAQEDLADAQALLRSVADDLDAGVAEANVVTAPQEPTSADPIILQGLRELRRMRSLGTSALWLLGPLIVLALVFSPRLGMVVLGLAVVGAIAIQLKLLRTPCPRCKQYFHRRARVSNAGTPECLHCGLLLEQHYSTNPGR